jgi:6-phosphogluconolactonase
VAAKPGAGPRHLAFHPASHSGEAAAVSVLNELGNTVVTYRWDARTGGLSSGQELSTLPAGFTGASTAAEIAIRTDGKMVCCSNRGHDSIALFRARGGALEPAGWVASGGKSPRYIGFEPWNEYLFAANEQGDNIATFRVDRSTDSLKPVGSAVRNASAVTIALIPAV